MKKKKAQIAIQFNWIFVIIAGALILLFFFSIAFRSSKDADTKVSRKIIDQIDTIFAGSEASTDTAQAISMPDVELQLECDELGYSAYSLSGQHTKMLETTALFSPNLIKGDKMTTWALGWSVPFRTMNFLYATSPLVRYYFVDPSPIIKNKLEEELPPNDIDNRMMTWEIIDSSDISNLDDLNNYKVKFIFFGDADEQLPEFFDYVDCSAVLIGPSNKKAEFYRKENLRFVSESPGQKISYMTDAEFYGLIFSEDKAYYECNMKKAFERLYHVSRVYGGKAYLMSDEFSNSACGSMFTFAYNELYHPDFSSSSSSLDKMSDYAKDCSIDISQTCIEGIEANKNSIIRINNNLERASCPLIY